MKSKVDQKINQTKQKTIENINKNLPLPNPSPEEISRVFDIWRGSDATTEKSHVGEEKTKRNRVYSLS